MGQVHQTDYITLPTTGGTRHLLTCFTVLCRGQRLELKADLLPLRRESPFLALSPLEAPCQEQKRESAEGSDCHKLLGAAHLRKKGEET